ncbi:MAG: 3-methyl-2-oxobutanoate hydroxymethyltransferase, partial [Acidimicrobiia bacterium]
MISAANWGSEAASIVGIACALRGIMTAGLVVGDSDGLDDAVTALRPYASVLVVSADEDYIPEMLAALRA